LRPLACLALTAALSVFMSTIPARAFAEETPPSEDLPLIEAKIYNARISKVSPTKKAYVLERLSPPDAAAEQTPTAAPSSTSEPAPAPVEGEISLTPQGKVQKKGKILMLRQNGQNVMALRVLREHPEKNEIYAKRIRVYGERDTLSENDEFR